MFGSLGRSILFSDCACRLTLTRFFCCSASLALLPVVWLFRCVVFDVAVLLRLSHHSLIDSHVFGVSICFIVVFDFTFFFFMFPSDYRRIDSEVPELFFVDVGRNRI